MGSDKVGDTALTKLLSFIQLNSPFFTLSRHHTNFVAILIHPIHIGVILGERLVTIF